MNVEVVPGPPPQLFRVFDGNQLPEEPAVPALLLFWNDFVVSWNALPLAEKQLRITNMFNARPELVPLVANVNNIGDENVDTTQLYYMWLKNRPGININRLGFDPLLHDDEVFVPPPVIPVAFAAPAAGGRRTRRRKMKKSRKGTSRNMKKSRKSRKTRN